jgi:hypothetical protein
MVGEPGSVDSEGPVTDDIHRMASPLAIAKCPGSGPDRLTDGSAAGRPGRFTCSVVTPNDPALRTLHGTEEPHRRWGNVGEPSGVPPTKRPCVGYPTSPLCRATSDRDGVPISLSWAVW